MPKKLSQIRRGLVLLEVLIATSIMGAILFSLAAIQRQYTEQQMLTSSSESFSEKTQGMVRSLLTPVFDMQDASGNLLDATDAIRLNAALDSLYSNHETAISVASPFGLGSYYMERTLWSTGDKTQGLLFFNGSSDNCSGQIGLNTIVGHSLLGCVDAEDFDTLYGMKFEAVRIDLRKDVAYFTLPKALVFNPALSIADKQKMNRIKNVQPVFLTLHYSGLTKDNIPQWQRLARQMAQRIAEDSNSVRQVRVSLAHYGIDDKFPAFHVTTDANFRQDFLATSATELKSKYFSGNLTEQKWGVVFEISLPEQGQLRTDGTVSIAKDKALCWTFNPDSTAADAGEHDSNTCITSNSTGIELEGGLSYISTEHKLSTSAPTELEQTYKTPVEASYHFFKLADTDTDSSIEPNYKPGATQGQPVKVDKIVCPWFAGSTSPPKNKWKNRLGVVTSSFSNSGVGKFDDAQQAVNSTIDHPADPITGLVYNWYDNGTQWVIQGRIGAPELSNVNQDDMHGYGTSLSVINPPSVSFVVYQWCEREP